MSHQRLFVHQRCTNGSAVALLFTSCPAVFPPPSENIWKFYVMTKGTIWQWIKGKLSRIPLFETA